MRKILATAAVAGIMAIGFAAAPAQASTTSQSGRPLNDCEAVRVIKSNFDGVEVAAQASIEDGFLNRKDLWTVATDRYERPIVRQAANILRGPLFDRVDDAATGSRLDGRIRIADLRAFYADACA